VNEPGMRYATVCHVYKYRNCSHKWFSNYRSIACDKRSVGNWIETFVCNTSMSLRNNQRRRGSKYGNKFEPYSKDTPCTKFNSYVIRVARSISAILRRSMGTSWWIMNISNKLCILIWTFITRLHPSEENRAQNCSKIVKKSLKIACVILNGP
jgi:hypothetical protein